MTLGSILGPDNIPALGRRNSHSSGNGSGTRVVTGHHQGLRLVPMLGLYVTISGNVGPRLQVRLPSAIELWTPTWSLAAGGSGCYYCPKRGYDPETLTWSLILGVCKALVVTGALDISTDPVCRGTTDPGMALKHRHVIPTVSAQTEQGRQIIMFEV